MTEPVPTIDRILKKLAATLDADLRKHGARSQGDKTEVGYFELGNLIDYVEEQRNNFVLIERMVNTIAHTEELLGMPTVMWRDELRLKSDELS